MAGEPTFFAYQIFFESCTPRCALVCPAPVRPGAGALPRVLATAAVGDTHHTVPRPGLSIEFLPGTGIPSVLAYRVGFFAYLLLTWFVGVSTRNTGYLLGLFFARHKIPGTYLVCGYQTQ
jgi:hypothetical protein